MDANDQRIGNNRNLERVCDEFGLDIHIVCNPSQNGFISPRVKQNTVEAIIGAAFLDDGLAAAAKVLKAFGLE